jgi:hypothetical protein
VLLLAGRRRRGPCSCASRRPLLAIALLSLFVTASPAPGEEPAAKPRRFRDPIDGAFDIGGTAGQTSSFLPLILPITEPAVGVGAVLAVARFHGGGGGEKALGVTGKPVPSSVSAVGGALTDNGTWGVFAGHSGYWGGDRWRYTGGVGWLAPQLDLYDTSGRAYGFRLEGLGLLQELRLRIGRSDLFLGARYVYFDSEVSFERPPELPELPESGTSSRLSGLGVMADFDSRDNVLTPSSGMKVQASATFYDSAIGSDETYQSYGGSGSFFWDPKPRLVVFARVRGDSTGGSPPFYAVPYVRLRGTPALRYQGDTALSVDGEAKWGLTKRWWLVAFAGAGWTANETSLLRQDESVSAGGAGFRYLLARSLGLQVGVDAAKGPEEWAFYFVVGASP